MLFLKGYAKVFKPKRLSGSVIEGFQLYNKPLLVSYSRSGTNWIRYIVEYLSGKPTPGAIRLVDVGYDFAIDRAHKGFSVINRYKKALLVIRDYRECLLRHCNSDWQELNNVVDFLESNISKQAPKWYIENIASFDSFEGEKLCIYYEDLVQFPEQEILKMVEFLELPRKKLKNLLNNLEEHKLRSIQAYSSTQKSFTAGKADKLNYYATKHLSEQQQAEFDLYYKNRYPKLYQKYLKRYEVGQAN